ncbi:putative transcriptional regulator [Aciduliprofundum sp. MAR08-339]|uniref:ArsR/SmtB family transcription factor n=1 Tax=Aciduliprofundum sp. (strain MAR08-339) TaxID=673860 RepID=UPI0002A48B11|nr:putative transcriptional regulator [Aciduliprofundum sp. MAR08-339]
MSSIDELLNAIENQTRREILKRLAEGRQYALQLAKELRVSQQAIVKHLEILERSNIIRRAGTEKSEMGPPRKLYEVHRGFSIVIDVAPGIFEIREYPIEEDSESIQVEDFGKMLEEIERELRDIERRRVELIKMKERILREMM